VGADTTLARIIRRVEEAQEERVPVQRFIDRFARWYTPAIIGLSTAAGVLTGDVRLALTLLVIGCPGALVIAAPVAVVAGIGRAAQRGILIKGGAHLERAGEISALALDKTGTLTEGRPRLTDVVALSPEPVLAGTSTAPGPEGPGWRAAQRDVLRWAAIAESGSEHPLARPIVAAAQELGVVPQADSVEISTGRGIVATHEDHTIAVGTTGLMAELGVEVIPEAESALARLRRRGRTAILVALDGRLLGVLGIADTLRPGAREAIEALRRIGVRRIEMLTGDNAQTARAIAEAVGVDAAHAQLLPDRKLEYIRKLQREGHIVAMAGDGINDAPALAAADVGIAMGAAGTSVAIETAPVALMSDDLTRLPQVVSLSRRTLRVIRQNLALALLTVGGLLTGVLLGHVDMAGGMLIHQLSVLLVVVNGVRLLRA
ncbi:MAG: cation-translocating P-type ATPase, partial [Actinomycetota bacterium]